MKKISVIGHFAFGENLLNGQTVKTKIVTEELCRQLGEEQVMKIDTHGGFKNLIKAPFQVFTALRESKNVIIFPAHNGLRIYAPLLAFLKPFFRGRRIHYAVIGAWLGEFIKSRRLLLKCLKSFDGIYAETDTLKRSLEKSGLTNVKVVPNCKQLNILESEALQGVAVPPLRLCTFSRVMKEKGIQTAAEVVEKVNKELGFTAYTLDIFGQIESGQEEWFVNLREKLPDFISYQGFVDADRSVEVLKDYFALLFPTHFYTEGIPGTVIDAYAAGVPVISAKWQSYGDVIDEGITGMGYDFDSIGQLEELLLKIADKPEIITSMKQACLNKARQYTPETAVRIITENLG